MIELISKRERLRAKNLRVRLLRELAFLNETEATEIAALAQLAGCLLEASPELRALFDAELDASAFLDNPGQKVDTAKAGTGKSIGKG